jgi:hypothetical protein
MNKILRDDDNAKKELLEMLQRLDKPQRDY